MSTEQDNIATAEAPRKPAPAGKSPPLTITATPAPKAAAAPAGKPTLRQRLRAARVRFDAWLAGAPLQPGEIPGMAVFEREAVEVMSRQHTLRARKILRIAAFIVVALLVWSAFARVDEVTRGEGRVVPSKQLQVLQSLDGGVVEQIKVREGEVVDAGQVLLMIDPTRATSAVADAAAQGFALEARVARLRALAQGTSFLPPTPASDEERALLDGEKRLYDSRVTELQTQVQIVHQQLSQHEQELAEMQARKSAAQRALDLSTQELNQTRPLLATGAVSQVDILRLERDVTKNRGDMEQAQAQIGRAGAAIQESSRKIQETELAFRNEAGRDLAEAVGKLNALNQGQAGLADKVSKTQVKSPVRGRVQRLLANTVGGVVQPGKDIVEIVPLDDSLVLDARVQPRDIAFIHPGQKANVKFTAYDFSIYGGLDAQVENISPDTITDERGNAFYLVRVRTTRSNFSEKMPIIPGMTAEVNVLTGQKTVLAYVLKPVLKIKANALRER